MLLSLSPFIFVNMCFMYLGAPKLVHIYLQLLPVIGLICLSLYNVLLCPVCFKVYFGEFPGSPVVRTQRFHCHGLGSIPGWGTKIPEAAQNGQKKKKKRKEIKTNI